MTNIWKHKMTETQKRKLEQQLWKIANELRGKMDADEFKDYMLGFIFYKYLSEKVEVFANKELSNDNVKFRKLKSDSELFKAIKEECENELGYFLPYELHFSKIVDGDDESVIENVQKAFEEIQKSTEDKGSAKDFENLFEDLNLNSSKLGSSYSQRNDLVYKILSHLKEVDFDIENPKSDILGDAYEYLIAQFAAGSGKKGGEFYTPSAVSTLLAKIVLSKKTLIKSVYDPTCGSGSLLLKVKKYANQVGRIYGQELNRTTYNLARMNMLLHDVKYQDFDIKQGNTLKEPRHSDKKFDVIVANPPFSAHWEPDKQIKDLRFDKYGKMAPASKADYAFIQHMIYHLKDDGMMAVVVPHGVLFRSAAEGHIRQYLIENKNYLDAVIGLPANLFYGTSIPACILVFKKCREHSDNILFIDASKEFRNGKNQNFLDEEHIQKILYTYEQRQEIEKYSHIASLEEIKENDYNLNIPRYVDTFEEEEEVDLNEVQKDIERLEAELVVVQSKMAEYLKELGV